MKHLAIAMAFVMGLFVAPAVFGDGQAAAHHQKSNKFTSAYSAKKRKKAVKRRYTKKRRATKKRRYAGVVARVNLSTQRMHVYENGRHRYTWKVSSGRGGYRTPTGSWRVGRMHKTYYSRKYNNAPMPYSMFFYRGYAIHGTNAISRLGRPASHGCIRLHPSNAAKLFAMMKRKGGRVRITY